MNLIPSEMSAEGAYDLAIEAAALRIQMVSRDGVSVGSSGGYSSDGELSEASSSMIDISAVEDNMEETEDSSLTDNSSSVCGNASAGIDSGDETEDIDAEISYLKQKQQILEKATFALKKEEAFIALNARSILLGANHSTKLWDEAKFFLEALRRDPATMDDFGKRKVPPSVESPETVLSIIPAPKRLKIDVSMVKHIRAGSYPCLVSPSRSSSVAGASFDGPSLDSALQFTTHAQIITMPSPPFSVVFINKAFCELSGLDQTDVIGKPVDSILQVDQDFLCLINGTITPSRFLVSRRVDTTTSMKECQFQVLPISGSTQNVPSMTHILLRIESISSPAITSDNSATVLAEESSLDDQIKKNSHHPKNSSHQVTIG